MNDQHRGQNSAQEERVPLSIRVGLNGLILSYLGLSGGAVVVGASKFVFPQFFANGVPDWLWPILILIWSPGILGLSLSLYTIARYPYFAMPIDRGENPTTTRSWVFFLLGNQLFVISPIVFLVTVAVSETVSHFLLGSYVSLEIAVVAFFLAVYDRERHVTLTTFLTLTLGIGLILFPIYIPSLLIGSIRYQRLRRSLRLEQSNIGSIKER